jgi:hypothetical protein
LPDRPRIFLIHKQLSSAATASPTFFHRVLSIPTKMDLAILDHLIFQQLRRVELGMTGKS